MTDEQTAQTQSAPLALRQATGSHPVKGYEPLEGGCNLPNLIGSLLKKPLSIIHDLEAQKNPGRIITCLILISVACLSVFGFVVGTFSWNNQLWAAPLKIVLGLFFSGLICLPSLYIFSCLGGVNARFQTITGVLCAFIALSGLLLIGFTPVIWLFSVSSTSASFLGALLILLWGVCVGFGFVLALRAGRALGMTNISHIILWCLVFLVVTLQMTTTLRPIVGADEKLFNFGEKKFFLRYWGEQVMHDLRPGNKRDPAN